MAARGGWGDCDFFAVAECFMVYFPSIYQAPLNELAVFHKSDRPLPLRCPITLYNTPTVWYKTRIGPHRLAA